MSTVTLDELHERTAELLAELPQHRSLTISRDGRPVAVIQSLEPLVDRPAGFNPFLRREFLPGVEKLMNTPLGGTPVDQIIDEDRSRE